MTMGQQKTIEASKTGAAAQQLTLGTLPAIHQDTVSPRLDKKGRMVAFCRWDARRCPQKGEREHRPGLPRSCDCRPACANCSSSPPLFLMPVERLHRGIDIENARLAQKRSRRVIEMPLPPRQARVLFALVE